jgi:hypothetical protein
MKRLAHVVTIHNATHHIAERVDADSRLQLDFNVRMRIVQVLLEKGRDFRQRACALEFSYGSWVLGPKRKEKNVMCFPVSINGFLPRPLGQSVSLTDALVLQVQHMRTEALCHRVALRVLA